MAFGLIAVAVIVRIIDPVPVQIVRNLIFDYYQQIQPREPGDFPVSILDIDDGSIAEIGQWPWPRTRFAELIDKARADGAAAIAFDVVFAEPDRLSPPSIAGDNPGLSPAIAEALRQQPENDTILALSIARGNVVVGQTNVRSAFAREINSGAIPSVPHALVGPDPAPFIMTLPELVQNLPALEAAADGRGLFSTRPDPDGVYRRLPLVALAGGELRLGLAPELLRIGTGSEPFVVRTNDAGIDGVVLARNLFETAGDGTVRPYLTASQPSRFVPAADLLADRMPTGRLNGHLVFVGTSAIGLGDYRATPLGVQMPGVEIHAQLMENMLSGTLLSRPNYAIAVELVAAFAICLLLIILTPIMKARILIVASLAFLSTCVVISFFMFQTNQVLLDASFPVMAALLTVICMATANYLREERLRREIRNAFRQYVSADLVNVLTENRGKLQLGGETRDLTLLFSDVRGFTAIAEGFRDNPAGLTRLMNRLMNSLSKAILDEKGTIDKFMGDAVMAFWNAPLDHPDHARAACRAALQMRDNVKDLNETRRAEAEEQFHVHRPMHVGIGIASGSCLVGNMGSDARFDYTAMGDPVNLASRLEGQTSFYGKTILISASTEAAVREDFAILELDRIRLKGKSHAETVFALMGGPEMRADPRYAPLRVANTKMLEAYRARDWDGALAALDEARDIGLALDPNLETHFDKYSDRVAAMQATPPPDSWDGVYDATSK